MECVLMILPAHSLIVYTPIPQTIEPSPLDTSIIVSIFLSTLIVLILLLFAVVTCVMGYFLIRMRINISKQKPIAPPAHRYEYIDIDNVAENMSPNKARVPTQYIEMHPAVPEPPPQYSNLK